MNPSAERWACDTSVAIAALDPTNEAHSICRQAVIRVRPALAGHAAFEAWSVLTRMPLPNRLRPDRASSLLAAAFPQTCWLDAAGTTALWTRLSNLEISGGAIYDALVAEAARSNGCRLMTRDRRAERTYQAIGVEYLFVS